jgi:nicotinate-nucleotide adenylyltransferase
MKTGLFFGSFNPIHVGHLTLANYFVEFTDIEQLWFVISPHNPLKKKDTLLKDHLRLEMVELAINKDTRFGVCDIEFKMPRPSYTIDTLTYLSEKYPTREFIIIMGADSLSTFNKWKNYTQIIRLYQRYVYPRDCVEKIDFSLHQNIMIAENAPKIQLSSTFIRQSISKGKDIRYFVPEKVYDFIERMNLYKSSKK